MSCLLSLGIDWAGKDSPSRMSKGPDVSASEYREIDDVVNTGENQEFTMGSLKNICFWILWMKRAEIG